MIFGEIAAWATGESVALGCYILGNLANLRVFCLHCDNRACLAIGLLARLQKRRAKQKEYHASRAPVGRSSKKMKVRVHMAPVSSCSPAIAVW